MMLSVPADLPGHPFPDQLSRIAVWAHLDPAILLQKQSEIAAAINDRKRLTEMLMACCPGTPWSWPAYEELTANASASDDDEDDVRHFHPDPQRDMVSHIAHKLMSNHRALHHLQQMMNVIGLRPFWQLHATGEVTRTYLANDPFWENGGAPWSCDRLLCQCRVYSLSRVELASYVEAGCSPGDEAAAELLKHAY